MVKYPELENKKCKLEIETHTTYNQEQIKQIVEDIIEKRLVNIQKSYENMQENEKLQDNSLDAIEKMLNNIDLFQ